MKHATMLDKITNDDRERAEKFFDAYAARTGHVYNDEAVEALAEEFARLRLELLTGTAQ